VAKVKLEVVLQRGQPPRVAGRPGLGDKLTSLPQILSCRHMERYFCIGHNPEGCKVGLVG
jgi:hypothetical protein